MADNPHDEEMGRVAACVAPWAEKAIRRDERLGLAELFEHHAESLAAFAGDKTRLIEMLAFMLRLDATTVTRKGDT